MPNDECPTVHVLLPHGPVVINETDWTPDLGPLCDAGGALLASAADDDKAAQQAADDAKAAQQAADAPRQQYFVEKTGKLHFVADEKGQRVVSHHIDAAGYKTDADAWAAILAIPNA
jgi:hypothetical protein